MKVKNSFDFTCECTTHLSCTTKQMTLNLERGFQSSVKSNYRQAISLVLLLTVLVRLKSNCQVIGLVLQHSLKLEECLEIKTTSVRIHVPFQHKDFHVCLQCLFSFCALADTAYYGEGEQMAVDCFPTGLPQWTLVSSCGTHNLSSHRLSVRKQN